MSDDNRDDNERPGAPTLTITENLALFGGAPERGEPDYREVWDEDHSLAALDEAMRIVVRGLTVDGTQMADEREQLMWGFVNVMHAQVQRLDGALNRITRPSIQPLDGDPERGELSIRDLIHAQDGSEVKANQLEALTARARNLADRSSVFEKMRDRAAAAYLAETGNRWHPRRGSLVSRTGHDRYARIDSADYARALEKRDLAADTPDGTLIALAGGKDLPDPKTVWAELDRALEQTPDMVLVHGDAPGVEKAGAAWAEASNVKQVPFAPDWDAHGKAAPFRRNEEMLKLPLDRLIAFPGSGITDNLVDRAHKAGIPVSRASLTPALSAARPSQAPPQAHQPLVINLKDHPDALKNGAIRIDRETRWGNPFRIGEHGSREEVIALYRKDLHKRIRSGDVSLQDLAALNRKQLACADGECHGEVLARAAIYAAGKVAEQASQQVSVSQHDRALQQPIQDQAAAGDRSRPAPSAAAGEEDRKRAQPRPDRTPAHQAGPDTGEPDRREVWDRDDTLAALDEAMRVLVRDVAVEGTQLSDEREQLMWGFANVLRAQAQRLDRDAARMEHDMGGLAAGPERDLLAGRVANLRERRDAFTQMHDRAAQAYFAETLKEWAPRHRDQASHTPKRTQAAVEAEKFLQDLEKRDVAAHAPEGTLVALTGGDTVTDPDAVWGELDRALEKHPGMILLHGDAPGVQKIGARWAEANDIRQVIALPDWNRHGKNAAPYRRNDQIVELQPKELIAFPGTGVIANLVDKAREAGIPVTEASLTRTLSPAETSRQATVINLDQHRDAVENGAIRIDGESRWANPFRIGEHGSREEVVALYRNDLHKRIRSGNVALADLAALNGKQLACAAGDCHGEVLARAATYAAGKVEPQAAERLSASDPGQDTQGPLQIAAVAGEPTRSATAPSSPEAPSPTTASEYWADVHNWMSGRENGEIHALAARTDPDHIAAHEEYVQDARHLLGHPFSERLPDDQRQLLATVLQNADRHDALQASAADPGDRSQTPALSPAPQAAVAPSTPETPPAMHASESFAARLQTFIQEEKQRHMQANRADIDSAVLPGLERHAASARQLIDHPQFQELPLEDRLSIKSAIEDHDRYNHATAAIDDICARLEPALDKHRHLERLAVIRDVHISKIDGYDEWRASTREISELGNNIARDPEVYDCGFTPEKWDEFRENLLELESAVGADTFFSRNAQLYLPQIPHALPGSDEALQAHASYRALYISWHDHIASTDGYDPHPYEDVRSRIVNAMESLANNPELPDSAREAVSNMVGDYKNYRNTRSDVETFLQDADRALDARQGFTEAIDMQASHSQQVFAEDIEGYGAWQKDTAAVILSCEAIVKDQFDTASTYLKHHPDLKEKLTTAADTLKDALDDALPSRTQDITQSQQIDQHRTVSRGMRM